MENEENGTGAKVGILIALFIIAIFATVWIVEHLDNPDERHTEKLEEGKVYRLMSSDSCQDIAAVELYVKSIAQDMEAMKATVRLEIEDRVAVRDTVFICLLYHAGTTLPLRVFYCGEYRTIGYIWSIYELPSLGSMRSFVKLRMEKGLTWKEQVSEYK